MATNLFAGNPPPNVVKWIEENVKSVGWADFDISKLGSPIAEKSLYETTVSTTCPVAMWNLQVLSDDSLIFKNITGNSANSCTIHWSFEPGHAFEVNHFKESPDERTALWVSWQNAAACVIFNTDGTEVITRHDSRSTGRLKKYSVGTPFDLTTVDGSAPIQDVGWGWNNCKRIFITPDGKRLFCDDRYQYLYWWDLGTAWDLTTMGEMHEINLNDSITEYGSWLYWMTAFTFDPAGKSLIVTGKGPTTYPPLMKIELTNPFDLESIDLDKTSFTTVQPARDGYVYNAIAVNNAGTKLILNESDQTFTNDGLFREFSLSK